MTRRIPIIPTIVVLAAVATMIALGVWQLGRRAEKEALIAQYEAMQAQEGIQLLLDPSSPEAAYTRTLQFCGDPERMGVISGRNANGQSGWVHMIRCTIGEQWAHTEANCAALHELIKRDFTLAREPTAKADFVASCVGPDVDPDPFTHEAPKPADVIMGWSRSSEPVRWAGGFVTGTVVPTGELGFKIVADPPLAGLEANAKPDPGDLPNNHLAYAVQWFFFAATALVIYVLALRRRRG